MSTSTRRRIRPVSRDTRFLRLRSLKCFKDVHKQVLEGWPPVRIAEFIQKEQGEYTDITPPSLKQLVSDYRSSLPKGDVVPLMSKFMAASAQAVKEEFSALDEMKKLFKLQKERIEIDVAHERNMKKLMPHTMASEMRVAHEIAKDIAELEMDLGVNKRHLGQINVEAQVISDVESRYDPAVTKAMEKPESRRKLLGIAERFLSLASGDANIEEPPQEPTEADMVPPPAVPEP